MDYITPSGRRRVTFGSPDELIAPDHQIRFPAVNGRPTPWRVLPGEQCPVRTVMSCPLRMVLRNTVMTAFSRRPLEALILVHLQRTFYISKHNSSHWLRKQSPPLLRGLRYAMWDSEEGIKRKG